MTQLKHVDPQRQRGRVSRTYARFSTTRPAKFISRHVMWKLDPILLRLTRGRFSMALVIRTGLLETRGAKSGALRRNAIIYFHDGHLVTIAASNAGSARNPAWYHNLRAHPEVRFGGTPMRATIIVDDGERQRLWALADRVFPPYAKFRREASEANRTIPIIQLAPSALDWRRMT